MDERLVGDACASFVDHCVTGMEPDERRVGDLLHRSLMLVTALAPVIGYDAAAKVAKTAHERGLSLKEAALELKVIDAEAFDRAVRPEDMIAPKGA